MEKKFFFFIFLRTGFWVPKTKFSPFFSAILSPIGLKIFLVILQLICGVHIYFFCRYLLSIKFGRIRKIFEILKCLRFSEILSILVLLPEVLGIFQNKKYTQRLGPSTYSKNFSSNGWNLWNCKGENFMLVFGPCGLWKSMKMSCGKFVSMTTFALLLEAYLPWKFQEFSLSRFLETPERGSP